MEAEGREILKGAGIATADITFRRTAEMRYIGQGHEVEVEVPRETLGASSLGELTSRFETAYRTLYSRTPLGVSIEALNWRLVVMGPRPDISMSASDPRTETRFDPIKTKRPAYFPEANGYVETPVYDRYRLVAGQRFEGPAIIEERESTTVIGPRARISVDARLVFSPSPHECRGGPRPIDAMAIMAADARQQSPDVASHPRAGMSVLDVGCGPGTLTTEIARRVDPAAVVGMNANPEMIRAAGSHPPGAIRNLITAGDMGGALARGGRRQRRAHTAWIPDPTVAP
jgi:hypothetical protein